jgi:hypothetical protein
MRTLQIFLVVIALAAFGVAGWALGSRDSYGPPAAGPAATEAPSPVQPRSSAPQDPVAHDGGRRSDPAPPSTRPAPAPRPKPTPEPEILGIDTIPFAPLIGGALHLDPGPGRVTFRVRIDNATRTQFWLAHGFQVDKRAIWLGEDSYGANGWSVGMRYGEQGFTDYLIIRATGPGGTAEQFVGVTNNGGM